jgi:hypothetical protein
MNSGGAAHFYSSGGVSGTVGQDTPSAKIDLDDFSASGGGAVVAYFEVIYKCLSYNATNQPVIKLYRDSANPISGGGPGTEVKSYTVTAQQLNWTRWRSSSFTLSSTDIYYNVFCTATGIGSDVDVLSAKIILIQSGVDTSDIWKTMAQFEIGSYETGLATAGTNLPLAYPKHVYIHGDNFDHVPVNSPPTDTPGAGGYFSINLIAPSTKGTSGGSAVKLAYTTDFVTWTTLPDIVSGIIGAGGGDSVSFIESSFASSQLTAPGGSTVPHWFRVQMDTPVKNVQGCVSALLGLFQDGGSTSSGITKTEEHFLMITYPELEDAGGTTVLTTGLTSGFFTYWDPTTGEWESVAYDFYHTIDVSSNVDEAHLSSSGAVVLTGSSVQGTLSTKHGAIGSSATMPAGVGEIDCFIDIIG